MIKVIAFLLINCSCFAQKFADDLNSIVKKIESEPTLSLAVSAVVKTSENGSVVYSSKSTLLRKKDSGFLTIIDGEELLVTKEYEVAVNKDQKSVIVQKVTKLDEMDFSKKVLADIQKHFENENNQSKNNYSEKLISDNQGIRTYSVKNMPGIAEMKIVLDMKSLKIVRVEYFFKGDSGEQGYYCLVNYETFDYSPSIDTKVVSTSNYFTIDTAGQYILAPRFNNYKLVRR